MVCILQSRMEKVSPYPGGPSDRFDELGVEELKTVRDSARETKERFSLQNNRLPEEIKRHVFGVDTSARRRTVPRRRGKFWL
jgi:hypothetical protein